MLNKTWALPGQEIKSFQRAGKTAERTHRRQLAGWRRRERRGGPHGGLPGRGGDPRIGIIDAPASQGWEEDETR